MRIFGLTLILALGLSGAVAFAAAPPANIVALTLHAHRFTPATISAPAGQRLQIVLTNEDGATEEFDSHDLEVEQLVTPHGRVQFSVGPLHAGRYAFMGEFHPETAQGEIVAGAGR